MGAAPNGMGVATEWGNPCQPPSTVSQRSVRPAASIEAMNCSCGPEMDRPCRCFRGCRLYLGLVVGTPLATPLRLEYKTSGFNTVNPQGLGAFCSYALDQFGYYAMDHANCAHRCHSSSHNWHTGKGREAKNQQCCAADPLIITAFNPLFLGSE